MGALADRVRVERRASLITEGDAVLWPDGSEIENADGSTVDYDGQTQGDGAGNFEADFRRIGPPFLSVEIRELRDGSEAVLAAKLTGVAPCLVIARVSNFTRQITTNDRFVELIPNGGERVLNIRTATPPGRRGAFITFMCEAGVAT